MKRLYLIAVIVLYVTLLMFVIFSESSLIYGKGILAVAFLMIAVWNIVKTIWGSAEEKMYILSIILGLFLLAWELCTTYYKVINTILYPMPEEVANTYIVQFGFLLKSMFSSLRLILNAYILAIPLGMILGVVAGCRKRLREVVVPIVRVCSCVPPVIYAPYLIAISPSFRGASLLLLTLTIFWAIFLNTVTRVESMDKRILYSVEPLGLDAFSMTFHILIPYVIPGVMKGLKLSFTASFVMLVFAEMLGAASGLGYFIKLYSDYANYPNVVAGIILIAFWVLQMNKLLIWLEKKIVRW